MTERERLIQLLQSSHCVELWNHNIDDFIEPNPIEKLADYLLANGVIVPPCKVGGAVYVCEDAWGYNGAIYYENRFIHSKYFVVGEIVSIIKTKKQLLMKIRASNSIHTRYRHKRYSVNALGKTVFLTREDAEKALKGAEKQRKEDENVDR